MTDNSPATDEEVQAAHKALMAELFLRCQPDRGDVFSFMDDHKDVMRAALSAASRIRAETAKNSGEVVATPPDGYCLVPRNPTEAMMSAGLYQSSHDSEWADVYSSWVGMVDAAEQELPGSALSTPANSRTEALEDALKNLMGIYDTPLSRRRFPQDDFMKEAIADARAVLATPAPRRAAAIGVKPLEWEKDGDKFWKAGNITGLYGILLRDDGIYSLRMSWSLMAMDGLFNTLTAAKTAAQADYEQRVRNTLLDNPQPDSRAEAIGAREAFLNMIADGELKVEPDEGDCYFTIHTNEHHMRELCAAIGIETKHEELLEDAIDRAIDAPPHSALLQQEGE